MNMDSKVLLTYKTFDAVNIKRVTSICIRTRGTAPTDKEYYILFTFGSDDNIWWHFKGDLLRRNAVHKYIINKYLNHNINDEDLSEIQTVNKISDIED